MRSLSFIPSCSFVDIHSHVLYELDDGAKNFEQSVAMLEMAASGGTTDIVATPHSNLTYGFFPDQIDAQIGRLNATLAGKIRVHSGCDFHLHFENIQDCLQHPTKYTINHARYLLVEFADHQIPKTTDEVFRRMLDLDITPIVTHPERNPLLQKSVDQLAGWVRAGCLMQVTAHSLLDRFGKRARQVADELMERGLVHFVASDAHDTVHRPPLLADAFAYVMDRYGAAQAQALFSANPKATLTAEYLDIPEVAPKRKKRWPW